jgi:threonine synthase
MSFISTRGRASAACISAAMTSGVAGDGGLYVPKRLDWFDARALGAGRGLAEFASAFLKPFFAGDALEPVLANICAEAFDFPTPLVPLDGNQDRCTTLELFHGPTGAFKDFGARFLLACLERIAEFRHPLTALVATSGDTGGAVGAAAEGRSGIGAVILFPRGRVSAFQEQQLTCWSGAVRAIEVDGDFDDCQRLVKAALGDPDLVRNHHLTSANSINLGRLLPQAAYLAFAAFKLFNQSGDRPGFIIPTGNLGHGFAALLARAIGAPIGPIVLATNANRTLKEWAETGRFEPRASVTTLANAMDVGNPSNFERLGALQGSLGEVRVELVDDDQIQLRIRTDYEKRGYIWCPHSATAAEAYARLSKSERVARPWIVAATAHPYKFREIVEPLIGREFVPTPALASIIGRGKRKQRIPADVEALAEIL